MLAVLLEVGIDKNNIQANFCLPRLQKTLRPSLQILCFCTEN